MNFKHILIMTALITPAAGVFAPQTVYAQDADDGEGEEDGDYIKRGGIDWTGRYSTYTSGDKIFGIRVGIVFPLFFVMNDDKFNKSISGYGEGSNDMHIGIGGTGSLSYTQFISPHIFLGGEIQGSFAGTLAEKLICFIPISIKGGYQWTLGRFEFPLSLNIGMETHTYSASENPAYWGFFMKGQGSAFFRFNHDWSFGISLGWWWVPEWHKDKSQNVDGHFMDIMLAARYHF
ncbi:MAG: hypothetical protein LBG72_03050 [Spirochaetaceae bacterium]|jgi:hypothetical protein|nr:hypothetical protein [Spirochaetaceae bacterium]